MKIETVAFNGWKRNLRLSNKEVELIVTQEVGPRVLRFAFAGEPNLFAELPGQQGGTREKDWMIRGGHRLWIAPEAKPQTYEPDNEPVDIHETRNGIKIVQPAGPLTGVQKSIELTLSDRANQVTLVHKLANHSGAPVEVAAWALTVMAPNGMAVIPLPQKIPHTERLTHVQEWSLWGYTDLTDPRWTIGARYLFFRQDPGRGPNKLGIAHRAGWVAYQKAGFLFVKRFVRDDQAIYPDGNVNFETFANEDFLELESLGPVVRLAPNASVTHKEVWTLHRNVPVCRTEDDVDHHIRPLIG